jgi:Methane oxygenase PmoA
MSLKLIHTAEDHVEVHCDGNLLFRYVYRPRTLAIESSRPYLHPVLTRGGNVVTGFRPHDHAWHHGISMTSAHLGHAGDPAENFWGGQTYVHGQGYIQLDNNGRIEHRDWLGLNCDGANAILDESLQWVTHDSLPWLGERRTINAEVGEGYWQLGFYTRLTNLTSQPLLFGSPTTAGRSQAGYGGLFWRGPDDFIGGQILADGGLEGPGVMGRSAAWLAYIGAHGDSGQRSTLLFVDDPANPRYPNQWFVRNGDYAGASFAFMFDEEYALQSQAELALRYRIVIADGAWERERIVQVCK